MVDAWKTEAVHVSIYGSMARGDGGTQSDIDVFVVRPDRVSNDDPQWREEIDGLAWHIERWAGNQASIAEVAEGEIDHLLKEGRPIVAELRSDAIYVSGASIPTLLGGE